MKRTVLATIAALAILPAAAHADPSPRGVDKATGYYLALGDSLAAGYQPGMGDDKTGGYVGGVLDAVRAQSPKTKLVNLACSGETVATMVSGGRCAYEAGSQFDQALDFLHAHGQFTRVVTIDIGANDVQRCVRGLAVDLPCVQNGLNTVATDLPMVLGKLRSAAPNAQIVVLNYYNPFLAAWLTGPSGIQVAQLSAALQTMLNGVIAGAAAANGALIADVAAAFHSTDWSPAPGTSVPTNVATICAWTWMCTKADIHANDAGYAVLAATVAGRL